MSIQPQNDPHLPAKPTAIVSIPQLYPSRLSHIVHQFTQSKACRTLVRPIPGIRGIQGPIHFGWNMCTRDRGLPRFGSDAPRSARVLYGQRSRKHPALVRLLHPSPDRACQSTAVRGITIGHQFTLDFDRGSTCGGFNAGIEKLTRIS